jgi:hypothetical protein
VDKKRKKEVTKLHKNGIGGGADNLFYRFCNRYQDNAY